MGEPKNAITRRSALAEVDADRASETVRESVAIQLLAPRARFALRLDPSLLATAKQVAGFTLDMPINRRVSSGERVAMRLGPDEWLLSGSEGETARIAGDVESALVGLHHSLVDVSHRHTALSVAGARAADVLNSGCPLDLSPPAFQVGAATRTLLGKAEIILAKTDDLPSFEVECARSFAPYVQDFLLEGAREFRAHG
jgi:sarcosine oxidase, subunit gamma